MIQPDSFFQRIKSGIQDGLGPAADSPVSRFILGPRIISASKIIQKRLRDVLDKREFRLQKRHLLSLKDFNASVRLIENPSVNMPKALWGYSCVYLPKEVPVAIKFTEPHKNHMRFNELREAREVCENQNSQQLCVPVARTYGDQLIESRLPLTVYSQKHSIGLYLENVDKFDQAAAELAAFLCDTTIDDIEGNTHAWETIFSEVPIARYDNIAIYLENGKGKVGLIDLQNCSQFPNFCLAACKTAIRFFPYHFDIIFSTVMKIDPDIEKHRRVLENERDKVIAYFRAIYVNHRDFLIKKGITVDRPTEISLSRTRKDEIVEAAKLQLKSDISQYGNDPQVSQSFYDCLDFHLEFFKNKIEENVKQRESINSIYDLVDVRSLAIADSAHQLHFGYEKRLIFINPVDYLQKWFLSRRLKEIVRNELIKGNEIAFYREDYYNHDIVFL